MKTLSKRQILMLHQQLVEQTGGSDGIRDEGLLDSVLSAPFQSFEHRSDSLRCVPIQPVASFLLVIAIPAG